MAEFILVGLVVGGAALYLLRRTWEQFTRPSGRCCGQCQVTAPKIRLAAPPERVSSKSLT